MHGSVCPSKKTFQPTKCEIDNPNRYRKKKTKSTSHNKHKQAALVCCQPHAYIFRSETSSSTGLCCRDISSLSYNGAPPSPTRRSQPCPTNIYREVAAATYLPRRQGTRFASLLGQGDHSQNSAVQRNSTRPQGQ